MVPSTFTTLRTALVLAATLIPAAASSSQTAQSADDRFRFGRVLSGTVITHQISVKNEGARPMRIVTVQLTPPLVVTRMPASIGPGLEGSVQLALDTSRLRGLFTGEVHVILNDGGVIERSLTVEGEIVPHVEVQPAPAFFLAGRRGEAREASLEIVNHDPEPLVIDVVGHATDRFTTRLDTVEPGERFRLTLLLRPDGPGGPHTEPIVLRTSNPREPTVTVMANTILRERVYTFPETLDLGTLSLRRIQQDGSILKLATQTLMVYQLGGTDFRTVVRASLPQLQISSERGPMGDRYQNTITLNAERLSVGPIRGSLVIETNDAQFPRLEVPVSGNIVP
jgi:hypothetical protein